MITPHPKKSRALFVAALLTGSFSAALGGPADARSALEKLLLEPNRPSNPLCFLGDTLCFDAQERLRWEIRDNNFDFNDAVNAATDDNWLLHRFRVGVLWKPSPGLKFYVQGQDSREINSDRANIPGLAGAEGDDSFDLRQAWVEIGGTPDLPVSVKLGRQVLSYGDERLIGGFEWGNFARSFDAVKLSYKHEKFQIDVFTSSVVVITRSEFNKSDLFNGNENDGQQIFSGIYFTTSELPFGTLDLYGLLLNQKSGVVTNVESGIAHTTPRGAALTSQHSDFATFGGRLRGDPKKLNGFEFTLEGAYQNGQVRDQSLSAFAVTAGAGYNFATAWKPRLWAEYNYASGDDDPLDNDVETFQNLFPTNHKFYGYMDLFSWQNLHNPMISFRVTPVKPVTVQVDYHAFWLASTDDAAYRANGLSTLRPLNDTTRAADSFVGQEVDLTVTWNVNRWLQVQAGYSHFFAGDYLADTGPADDADFGYVMATLNF